MTDDNSFKNNPFKALEKGRFPQQKKTGAPAAPENAASVSRARLLCLRTTRTPPCFCPP